MHAHDQGMDMRQVRQFLTETLAEINRDNRWSAVDLNTAIKSRFTRKAGNGMMYTEIEMNKEDMVGAIIDYFGTGFSMDAQEMEKRGALLEVTGSRTSLARKQKTADRQAAAGRRQAAQAQRNGSMTYAAAAAGQGAAVSMGRLDEGQMKGLAKTVADEVAKRLASSVSDAIKVALAQISAQLNGFLRHQKQEMREIKSELQVIRRSMNDVQAWALQNGCANMQGGEQDAGYYEEFAEGEQEMSDWETPVQEAQQGRKQTRDLDDEGARTGVKRQILGYGQAMEGRQGQEQQQAQQGMGGGIDSAMLQMLLTNSGFVQAVAQNLTNPSQVVGGVTPPQ